MDIFCASLDQNCVSKAIPALAEALLVLECTHCLCACPFVFVPTFWSQTSVSAQFNVQPTVLQGRYLLEAFPLHQVSLKRGENSRKNGRETKGESERERDQERCNLSTIDWLHPWPLLGAHYHLFPSASLLSFFSPFFLIPFLCIFLF